MAGSPLRRTPQQERGEKRITRILDAAAQVINEVGYEAATTVAIAARAHTAIGSLYQFFPNKEAILQELLARYRTQLRAIWADILAPDLPALPLPHLLDRILDPLLNFELGQTGFMALFMDVLSNRTLLSATSSLTEEVVQMTASIFQARLPTISPAQAHRYSVICVQLVKSFLTLATPPSAMPREEAIRELKAVLRSYLTPIVG